MRLPAPRLRLALVAWTALASIAACAIRPNLPPLPADVKAAMRAVDDAFRLADIDPAGFRRAAIESLPPFRQQMERWADSAPGNDTRRTARGLAIEAGALETSVWSLTDPPDPACVERVKREWRTLRGKLSE
jgi:hypothetical protein